MAETIAASTGNKKDVHTAAYCRALYYVRKNITDSAMTIIESLLKNYKNDQQQQEIFISSSSFSKPRYSTGATSTPMPLHN
ncbi:MAG: hypothetical protein WDO16_17840 [Bacteroidota bacterium]